MQKFRTKAITVPAMQVYNNKKSLVALVDFLGIEDLDFLPELLSQTDDGDWVVKEDDGYTVYSDQSFTNFYEEIPNNEQLKQGYASTTTNGYGVDINDFNNTSIRSWQEQVKDLNAYHNYLDPERNR